MPHTGKLTLVLVAILVLILSVACSSKSQSIVGPTWRYVGGCGTIQYSHLRITKGNNRETYIEDFPGGEKTKIILDEKERFFKPDRDFLNPTYSYSFSDDGRLEVFILGARCLYRVDPDGPPVAAATSVAQPIATPAPQVKAPPTPAAKAQQPVATPAPTRVQPTATPKRITSITNTQWIVAGNNCNPHDVQLGRHLYFDTEPGGFLVALSYRDGAPGTGQTLRRVTMDERYFMEQQLGQPVFLWSYELTGANELLLTYYETPEKKKTCRYVPE